MPHDWSIKALIPNTVLNSKTMRKIIFLTALFFTNHLVAQQDNSNKANQSGLGIQLGTGLLYGGVGTIIEYQIKCKENLRLTPFLGTGVSIGGPPDQTDTVHSEGLWMNSAMGINLEVGKKHRLILGPQLISAYYHSEMLPQSPDQRFFLGFSMIAGYKGTSSFGLFWQGYLGLARIQAPLMTAQDPFLEPNVGLGLGYKF